MLAELWTMLRVSTRKELFDNQDSLRVATLCAILRDGRAAVRQGRALPEVVR